MSLRRIILIAVAGLALIAGLSYFINWLGTGNLSIETSDKAAVVTAVKDDAENPPKSKGRFSKRLKPGTYVVTVESGIKKSLKVVEIKARKSYDYTIETKEVRGVRTAAPILVESIRARAGSISYLEPDSQRVMSISSENLLPVEVYPSINNVTGLSWSGQSYGAVVSDNTGSYVTNPSSVKSVSPNDFSYGVPVTINNDGKYAMGIGKDIYLAEGFESQANKIYSAPQGYNLTLGRDSLLLSYPQDATSENENSKNQQNILLNLRSKKVHRFSGEAEHASWSPNGKFLSYYGSAGGKVIDGDTNILSLLPDRITSVVWRNDRELLYSRGDEVWSYDLADQLSEKIGTTPVGAIVTSSSLAPDGTVLYLSTKADNAGSIVKIELTGSSAVSKTVSDLQSILPIHTDHFQIDYYDLESPTIVITTLGIINRQSQQGEFDSQTQQYRDEALELLRDRGFDVSKLNIQFRS